MSVKVPTVRKAWVNRSRGMQIGRPSAYRLVFRCKTSPYVYKFLNSSRDLHLLNANQREYETYLKILETITLPEGVKLPEMYLLRNGVLAAEYIDGVHPEYTGCNGRRHDRRCLNHETCWADKVIGLGLRDLHYQNVMITKDGTIYLIDLDGGFDNLQD